MINKRKWVIILCHLNEPTEDPPPPARPAGEDWDPDAMLTRRRVTPKELQVQAPAEPDAGDARRVREERGARRLLQATSSLPLTSRVPGGYSARPSPSSGTVRPSEDSGFAAHPPRRSPASGGYSPGLQTGLPGNPSNIHRKPLLPTANLSSIQRPPGADLPDSLRVRVPIPTERTNGPYEMGQ